MANYPIDGVRLIQDNDSKHCSVLCEQALANNGINWVLCKSNYFDPSFVKRQK